MTKPVTGLTIRIEDDGTATLSAADWSAEGHLWAIEALLSSTDPAVHAAMLDALTRHGVLTQQLRTGGVRLVTAWREIDSDEALALLRARLTGDVPS